LFKICRYLSLSQGKFALADKSDTAWLGEKMPRGHMPALPAKGFGRYAKTPFDNES
jgi:hypothetical protein